MVLIMEYVPGGELTEYVQERMKDGYGLTETEARRIFAQLVDAVEYCHNHCIIHRDLKPENVLLANAETRMIKLIDFGISGGNSDGSKDSTTAGSLYVLPPEALKAQRVDADPAIDIWSMGVILYFCIYGTIPFRGGTEKEIINNIIKKKPPFPKGKKKISESCINLILQMLNKDPKSRIKMNDIYADEWFNMA